MKAHPGAWPTRLERDDMAQPTTKACSRCKLDKGIEEFRRNRSNRDGLQSECKACQEIARRAWRERRPEVERATKRRYRERHPDQQAEARKRELTFRPETRSAHQAVRQAVETGVLTRPDACEECGRECRPQAHHDDYAKPLDVAWLCVRCHQRLHANEQRSTR